MTIEWCEATELQGRIAALIRDAGLVLDVGCGIRPQQFVTPDFLICVEPHPEYVDILRGNLAGADAAVIASDARTALAALPDRPADTIFLLDVIEHLEKTEGRDLIAHAERVTRQQIVVFTPLGFLPQESAPDGGDA